MSRPRKPTNILELKGAFKKDPQRKRTGEPKPTTGIGEPPVHLNEMQQAAWHEIVVNAAAGVLTCSDRIAVEIAAGLLAELRISGVEFPTTRLARLESLLGRFGMTPADRSRVVVPDAGSTNPFDDL